MSGSSTPSQSHLGGSLLASPTAAPTPSCRWLASSSGEFSSPLLSLTRARALKFSRTVALETATARTRSMIQTLATLSTSISIASLTAYANPSWHLEVFLQPADSSSLFFQGRTFECPERVPFRLTQNIVDGFGVTGVEGESRLRRSSLLELQLTGLCGRDQACTATLARLLCVSCARTRTR